MTIPPSLVRKLMFLAFQVVAVLACGEFASYGVARFKLHESYSTMAPKKAEILRTVPQEVSASAESNDAPLPLNIRRQLHPFFGFTYESNPARRIVNNQGFLEDVDYPYQAMADEVVVGVFGGSVALDLRHSEARAALEGPIKTALRAKGYEHVRVLMFAQSAWREPQSIFCFLYEMESVDIAVFLEGYNEIGQLPTRDSPDANSYPWAFPAPQMYERLLGRSRSIEDLYHADQINKLRGKQIKWTRVASWGLLGKSMLVHMSWRVYIGVLQHQIEEVEQKMQSSGGVELVNLWPPGTTFEQKGRHFFERYRRWVEIAHQAGLVAGKPVFFFIQPNQYLSGSKPYSEEERVVALAHPESSAQVDSYYPILRTMCAELRSRGVSADDLSTIFQNTPDTVYMDSCCHMNSRGMKRLAEEIADTIVKSPLLGLVPNANERDFPFGPPHAGESSVPFNSATKGPRDSRTLEVGPKRSRALR